MAEEKIPLYIFLDEGGNFDFSKNGSKYFTLTSLTMVRNWQNLYKKLDTEKYKLLEYGTDILGFHCCEDNKYIRKKIFSILQEYFSKSSKSFPRLDSVIIEKSKTNTSLQEEKQFYSKMLGYLLKHIFEKINKILISEVIVITDNLPINKKKGVFKQQIKATLKEMLAHTEIKFKIYHHSSNTHYGLQIADYCNWAILRKWEKEDSEYYEFIQTVLKSEFDIFRRGKKNFY